MSFLPSARWFSVALLLTFGLACGCSKDTTPPAQTFNVNLSSPNELRDRIDALVDYTLNNRTLNTRDHNAWQIMHGILAYGHDLKIEHDGQMIGALDWLLNGGDLHGWELEPGDHGVKAHLEPGSMAAQGHPDQWVGILSQVGVKPDDKLVVQGKVYKVEDLATQAQWDLYPGMEACWTLWTVSTFYPYDHTWVDKDGEQWNTERLEAMEADAPVVGEKASCGGTHRLYGLTIALNHYMEQTGKTPDQLTGGWQKAHNVIQDCVRKAREFQQPDGNFSTSFFVRPGSSADVKVTLHATGHTLEWLDVALTKEQLQEPWVTAAVNRLCQLLEDNANRQLDCGALYHAARGLKLYREKVFGPRDSQSPIVARAPADSHGGDPIKPAAAGPATDDAAPAPPPGIGTEK
ncbi:MAG TPA: ADP-ribosylation factor-directed GTPase activating protein isoform b [Pirellulales bacterium]|nr:ADP-ribosylation factor-directed GTPase activating protein isoform b [Pirellulales bacterium]